jgi:hypothetical protein
MQFRIERYFIHISLTYVSDPPKDICLYEYQYISDAAGGERPRKTDETFISPKQVLPCYTFLVAIS